MAWCLVKHSYFDGDDMWKLSISDDMSPQCSSAEYNVDLWVNPIKLQTRNPKCPAQCTKRRTIASIVFRHNRMSYFASLLPPECKRFATKDIDFWLNSCNLFRNERNWGGIFTFLSDVKSVGPMNWHWTRMLCLWRSSGDEYESHSKEPWKPMKNAVLITEESCAALRCQIFKFKLGSCMPAAPDGFLQSHAASHFIF